MIQILQLQGTDKRLYQLVAPLVMNPEVLKQNYNYPFRTSEDYNWFIASESRRVVGFIPVGCKKYECVINNYYIKGKSNEVLKRLLEKVIAGVDEEKDLTAVCFLEDCDVFKEMGFTEEKVWTRYVKMKREREL